MFTAKLMSLNIFFLNVQGVLKFDLIPKHLEGFIRCRTNNRLVTLEEEVYETIEVEVKATVGFSCQFCGDPDDGIPKVWYRGSKNRWNTTKEEVKLGMAGILGASRVFITPNHVLFIQNASREDIGIYYCDGGQYDRLNFRLDVIDTHGVKIISGDLEQYRKYEKSEFTEINEQFELSNASEYTQLRNKDILLEVESELGNPEPCDGCTGKRKIMNRCRIRPHIMSDLKEVFMKVALTKTELDILDWYTVSCFALDFAKLHPLIASHLKGLRRFEVSENCNAPCKHKISYIKDTVQLGSESSVALICPGATMDTSVEWVKNGKVLKPPFEDGSLYIDHSFTLHITRITGVWVDGKYTCLVQGIPVIETQVVHVASSKDIGEVSDLARTGSYIMFLSMIYGIFYAAGLIIICTRRDYFKRIDFENPDAEYL